MLPTPIFTKFNIKKYSPLILMCIWSMHAAQEITELKKEKIFSIESSRTVQIFFNDHKKHSHLELVILLTGMIYVFLCCRSELFFLIRNVSPIAATEIIAK